MTRILSQHIQSIWTNWSEDQIDKFLEQVDELVEQDVIISDTSRQYYNEIIDYRIAAMERQANRLKSRQQQFNAVVQPA
jgi:hypothetical protein